MSISQPTMEIIIILYLAVTYALFPYFISFPFTAFRLIISLFAILLTHITMTPSTSDFPFFCYLQSIRHCSFVIDLHPV